MRILKIVAVGMLLIVVVAAAALYLMSERRLRRQYDIAAEQVVVATGPEAVAHGAHVATLHGCTDCHRPDLGGNALIESALLGHIYTPNLTSGRGGVAAQLTPADWERAIRHGVAPDGRGLLIMPSLELHELGNDDLADLIAYLQSVPPVNAEWPAPTLGPMGYVLIAFDLAPVLAAEEIDHAAPHSAGPAAGPTVEYGAYLAVTCTACHQRDFAGGPVHHGTPGVIAANLTMDETTGVGRWSGADFSHVLRTGTRPDGRQLSPEMPIALTASMTDMEVSAVWAYLKSLPVRPLRTE